MKLSGSWCVFTLVILASGFLCLAEVADGANEFRKCYNTSVETHCFDLQYDNTNNRWLTASFDNARQRCNVLNSTLLIIRDNETNNFVQNYISDPNNPIRFQNVWTDAYRVNDYNNSYTWHWLNPKLPTLAALEIGYGMYIYGGSYYTTTLEWRSENSKPPQFYLTAKQPQDSYSYLCEYSVSRCPSSGSNVLQITDRCYIPFSAYVSWYEARNRCLKDGGDLASFANVTSINFTSWLGSDPNVRFWIGLRFSWYIWKDSGEEVTFSKLMPSNADFSSLCLTVCSNCGSTISWLPKDCNGVDRVYVVCHSVTPLGVAATTVSTMSSAAIKTSSTTSVSDANIQRTVSSSSRAADGAVPVGIGLGVGLGVPLIIFIILTVVFALKIKRMETLQEQTTRSNNTELEAVHEPSVGKVNDSANNQYQQLNRSVDSSPGTTYDELRVSPETPYEEFPSQRN